MIAVAGRPTTRWLVSDRAKNRAAGVSSGPRLVNVLGFAVSTKLAAFYTRSVNRLAAGKDSATFARDTLVGPIVGDPRVV
jgi:hypothetical protein